MVDSAPGPPSPAPTVQWQFSRGHKSPEKPRFHLGKSQRTSQRRWRLSRVLKVAQELTREGHGGHPGRGDGLGRGLGGTWRVQGPSTVPGSFAGAALAQDKAGQGTRGREGRLLGRFLWWCRREPRLPSASSPTPALQSENPVLGAGEPAADDHHSGQVGAAAPSWRCLASRSRFSPWSVQYHPGSGCSGPCPCSRTLNGSRCLHGLFLHLSLALQDFLRFASFPPHFSTRPSQSLVMGPCPLFHS